MRTKIQNLLGNGLPQSIVSTSCGVSPAYVSQLMAEPEFAAKVAELRMQNLTAATDRDARLDKLEDAAIQKMEELIPFAHRPLEVTRMFMAINSAKRRGANNQGQEIPSSNQIIQLNMPVSIINNFKLSERKEVIEVDDRTLVSMQAPQLLKALKERSDANSNATSQRRLNAGTESNSLAESLA